MGNKKQPSPSLEPGTVLNQMYEIIREISHTGMSRVWLATTIHDQSEVAVKVIPSTSCSEIQIQTRLDHPNIVKVLDHFTVDDYTYVVTPYAPFGDVGLLIRKQYPTGLKKKTARAIFTQMLSAVRYLHSQGIIHNDIKLENFLVFDNNLVHPKVALADFGTAHFATDRNHFAGTVEYASPELCRGEHSTTKTDIWSLGVSLFALLCGHRPFDGKSRHGTLRRVIAGNVSFPRKWWYGREMAQQLIEKMLVTDPALRVSADEAMSDPWIN